MAGEKRGGMQVHYIVQLQLMCLAVCWPESSRCLNPQVATEAFGGVQDS